MKGKTSNISPCVEGFWKILRISRDERRNSRVTYVSGGKLRLTLNHKFTNHARFSVKFTRQVLNFGLNQFDCSRMTLQRSTECACRQKRSCARWVGNKKPLYKPNKIVPPFPVHNKISDSMRLHCLSWLEWEKWFSSREVKIFL